MPIQERATAEAVQRSRDDATPTSVRVAVVLFGNDLAQVWQTAGDEAITERVEAERAAQQTQADAVAERKYNATPEGVRELAAAERVRQEEHAARLADADTILTSKGWPTDDRADPSVQSVALRQQISEIAQRSQ